MLISRWLFFFCILGASLFSLEPIILLLGPPGSGKGTFSQYAKQYGYNHLSAGDFLRQEMIQQTDLGKQIEATIRNGDYIDVALFWQIMRKQITSIYATKQPFILDGFGRSPEDCEELLALLHDLCSDNPIMVLFLTSSDLTCKQRILQRVVCPHCNYVGSKDIAAPGILCPCCQIGKIELRCNDTATIIDKRLHDYHTYIEASYHALTQHFPHRFFSTECDRATCLSFYDIFLQSLQFH